MSSIINFLYCINYLHLLRPKISNDFSLQSYETLVSVNMHGKKREEKFGAIDRTGLPESETKHHITQSWIAGEKTGYRHREVLPLPIRPQWCGRQVVPRDWMATAGNWRTGKQQLETKLQSAITTIQSETLAPNIQTINVTNRPNQDYNQAPSKRKARARLAQATACHLIVADFIKCLRTWSGGHNTADLINC